MSADKTPSLNQSTGGDGEGDKSDNMLTPADGKCKQLWERHLFTLCMS